MPKVARSRNASERFFSKIFEYHSWAAFSSFSAMVKLTNR